MQHFEGATVGGFEFVAAQPLVPPDGLQEFFRRRRTIIVKRRDERTATAQIGVWIFVPKSHARLFAAAADKVKPFTIQPCHDSTIHKKLNATTLSFSCLINGHIEIFNRRTGRF
jgi:hypothetical protein